MRGFELRYLDAERAGQISELIEGLTTGQVELTGNTLWEAIIKQLPIERAVPNSVRQRIEGLWLASELLWNKILEMSKLDRREVVQRAKLKPLSYYHYLTGSREPINQVVTRDDYFHDPSTALAKLKDDVIGLTDLFTELETSTA